MDNKLKTYQQLQELVASMEPDCSKFSESKVKACATRYRAKLLACKKLCGDLRKQVLADVKTIPVKSKSSPIDIPTSSPVKRSMSTVELPLKRPLLKREVSHVSPI